MKAYSIWKKYSNSAPFPQPPCPYPSYGIWPCIRDVWSSFSPIFWRLLLKPRCLTRIREAVLFIPLRWLSPTCFFLRPYGGTRGRCWRQPLAGDTFRYPTSCQRQYFLVEIGAAMERKAWSRPTLAFLYVVQKATPRVYAFGYRIIWHFFRRWVGWREHIRELASICMLVRVVLDLLMWQNKILLLTLRGSCRSPCGS